LIEPEDVPGAVGCGDLEVLAVLRTVRGTRLVLNPFVGVVVGVVDPGAVILDLGGAGAVEGQGELVVV